MVKLSLKKGLGGYILVPGPFIGIPSMEQAQTTRQSDPAATVSNQPAWQLKVHSLLVSPLGTGARLLQEHTPVLHLLPTALQQEQAPRFPATDRHCNRGTAAFWGEPTSDPRWKASHLLLCRQAQHIFPCFSHFQPFWIQDGQPFFSNCCNGSFPYN